MFPKTTVAGQGQQRKKLNGQFYFPLEYMFDEDSCLTLCLRLSPELVGSVQR